MILRLGDRWIITYTSYTGIELLIHALPFTAGGLVTLRFLKSGYE